MILDDLLMQWIGKNNNLWNPIALVLEKNVNFQGFDPQKLAIINCITTKSIH